MFDGTARGMDAVAQGADRTRPGRSPFAMSVKVMVG